MLLALVDGNMVLCIKLSNFLNVKMLGLMPDIYVQGLYIYICIYILYFNTNITYAYIKTIAYVYIKI